MNRTTFLSPAAEYERLRRRRRIEAEQKIGFNGRCFLVLQLTVLASLIYFSLFASPARSFYGSLIAGTAFWAAWLFSLFFAGRAAVVVASRLNLLESAWWAIGLAPWAMLMAQMTVVLTLMILF